MTATELSWAGASGEPGTKRVILHLFTPGGSIRNVELTSIEALRVLEQISQAIRRIS